MSLDYSLRGVSDIGGVAWDDRWGTSGGLHLTADSEPNPSFPNRLPGITWAVEHPHWWPPAEAGKMISTKSWDVEIKINIPGGAPEGMAEVLDGDSNIALTAGTTAVRLEGETGSAWPDVFVPWAESTGNSPGWQRTRHAVERYLHPDPPEGDAGILQGALAWLRWYRVGSIEIVTDEGEPWESRNNYYYQADLDLRIYGWRPAFRATSPGDDGRWPDGIGLDEVWECAITSHLRLVEVPGPGSPTVNFVPWAESRLVDYGGHEMRSTGALISDNEDWGEVTVTPAGGYPAY